MSKRWDHEPGRWTRNLVNTKVCILTRVRGEQRAQPRWRLEETGTQKPKKEGVSDAFAPYLLETGKLRGGRFAVISTGKVQHERIIDRV